MGLQASASGPWTVNLTDDLPAKQTAEQNLPPGADAVADVQRVERQLLPIAISTATTTVVKSGSGYCGALRCVGGTLGNVTVYDNTAASGTIICPTVTPVANGILIEDVVFNVGLTVVTAAATVLTGSYR